MPKKRRKKKIKKLKRRKKKLRKSLQKNRRTHGKKRTFLQRRELQTVRQ